ncbi:MAG TPA: hypothetical protein VGG60_13890 [Candidatus Binataceae bacterium]
MADKTTGSNVNRVDFSNLGDKKRLGVFRQAGLHVWKEDHDQGGRDLFELTETGRDAWSVYLFDNTRKVNLQLDLFKKTVWYSDPATARREQYDIIDATSKATGWLVNRVEVGTGAGPAQAIYKQVSATGWTEDKPSGVTSFNFVETSRDDWSVYLLDKSRNVRLQLDLFREVVSYAADKDPLKDLYKVASASMVVNGWLVNTVAFRDNAKIGGSFRQSGAQTWVEDHAVLGRSRFQYHETGRDEWSVYLFDASRNVKIQLDLFTKTIFYSDETQARFALYAIDSVDVLPRLGLDDGKTVNLVEYGDASGNAIGHFRQTSEDTWSEDIGPNRRDAFRFQEVARDQWSVYMLDASRDTWIQIDLFTNKIMVHASGAQPVPLYEILDSSSTLNGWMTNYVTYSNGGSVVGLLRQNGWTSWVEESLKDQDPFFIFDETGRTDQTIRLHDASRDVTLVIDLSSKEILYANGNAPLSKLYVLASALHGEEGWRVPRNIHSRAALTEDYEIGSNGGAPTLKQVYRCSVSLPAPVSHADIWASEEVTLQIDDVTYTVDRVRSVRVRPSALSKLSITMPAEKLSCPVLYLRTNLMKPDANHILMADVELHKKLSNLKDDAMWNSRQELGISPSFDQAHTAAVQKAVKNLTASVQYAYNDSGSGLNRDRGLLPANMQDPHFMMDFSSGGATYQPLSKAEVIQRTQHARRIDGKVAQGIWDDIKDAFGSAKQIIVHTFEKTTDDVIDFVKHTGADLVNTVDQLGEDLIHGDFHGAAGALIQGGENIGKDLFKGVVETAGDVLSGSGQLLAVTLELGGSLVGDAVQFVIDHTGFIGEALGALLDKAGILLGKALGWLLDKVGWGDIVHTHDVILDMLNKKLDEYAAFPQALKKQSDKFFADLATNLNQEIDKALAAFGISKVAAQPRSPSFLSGAIEMGEWLLSKWFHYATGTDTPAIALAGPPQVGPPNAFEAIIEDKIGRDGDKIKAAFGDAFENLLRVFTDSDHAPQHIIGALLELARAVGQLGLELISGVIDVLLDMVTALIEQLKSAMNAELKIPFLSAFYEGLTDGRKMTLASISALIIATPMTLIGKAIDGKRPFDHVAVGAAANLHPNGIDDKGLDILNAETRGLGLLYASCQIVLGVVATAVDVKKAAAAMKAAKAAKTGDVPMKVRILNPETDDDDDYIWVTPPKEEAEEEASPLEIGGDVINLTVSFIALLAGAPQVPGPNQTGLPDPGSQHDVFQAPDYWANVIWWYSLAGWITDLIFVCGIPVAKDNNAKPKTVKIAGEIYLWLNGVRGCVLLGLMSTLDYYDRRKSDALSFTDTADFANAKDQAMALQQHAIDKFQSVPNTNPSKCVATMTAQDKAAWVEAMTNYYKWSWLSGRQGIPLKTFANLMDAFPEIGQIGATQLLTDATEGISVAVMAAVDGIGHLSEGIANIVRVSFNGIL